MSSHYSLEAEQAVLGSLLFDNTTWSAVQEQLNFKDFYQREHQILFDLISKKISHGETIDALMLSDEVKRIPELQESQGDTYVLALLNQTYSTVNISAYAAIVKEHAQRRYFKALLENWEMQANDGNIKKLAQQASQDLTRLAQGSLSVHQGVYSQLFSEIPYQSIDWLWPGRIARGKVTIIAGDPGLGKSQITASLAAIVTTGGIWPVDQLPCRTGKVIFLSAEDDPGDTIGPRLNAAGADLTKTYYLKGIRTQNQQGQRLEKSFSLKTDLIHLDRFLDEVKEIALLIIDPITAYLGETDSYKNAEVRALLTPLSELAMKHNLAVLVISHLNKSSNQDPLMRVSGSLAFVAAARAAFLVAQDPNDENRRMLLPMKNNIGNDKTGLAFSIEPYTLEEGIQSSRIVWAEESITLKANEVMAKPSDPEESSALKEAIEFLKDELAIIPKSVNKIKKAANNCGLSWRTVYRAKSQLEIVVKKEGFQGGWIWSLPKSAKRAPEDDHKNDLAAFEDSQEKNSLAIFEESPDFEQSSTKKGGKTEQNLKNNPVVIEACQRAKNLATFEDGQAEYKEEMIGSLGQNLSHFLESSDE